VCAADYVHTLEFVTIANTKVNFKFCDYQSKIYYVYVKYSFEQFHKFTKCDFETSQQVQCTLLSFINVSDWFLQLSVYIFLCFCSTHRANVCLSWILTILFSERGWCVCFAAMEFGQQTLPFKKIMRLANGQEAICLPHTKPSMWSGFACQLCKLTFKTKQALAGHKTSILHKGRVGDQTNVVVAAPLHMVFPAITPSAQSSGTSTPVCSPVTPSSSTASSSIARACSRKQQYVRISRPKLTRGATTRKRWSVFSKADIVESLSKFEDSEVNNKKYAVTARLFKVPVGNLFLGGKIAKPF
jgi:hypothetical protein